MGKRPTVIGELERKVEAAYGKYVTKEDLEEKIHMDITYED